MQGLTPVPDELYMILMVTVAALATGSLCRWIGLRGVGIEIRRRRLASLRTWWILLVLFAGSLLLGRLGVILLFATASGFALREYVKLIRATPSVYGTVALAALVIGGYTTVLLGWSEIFARGLPLVAFIVAALLGLSRGAMPEYLQQSAGLYWGLMLIVYGLAHVALLFTTFETHHVGPLGPFGWVTYLVILTEMNDIAQALIGRRLGSHNRHRITPTISPNKTWEGFIGGAMVTVVLAVVLAPPLTSLAEASTIKLDMPFVAPALAGLLIALGGFLGDINMSAVKRSAGVKDSGRLLAGMGGVIDRVDSLTITAPAFTYFAWWITT